MYRRGHRIIRESRYRPRRSRARRTDQRLRHAPPATPGGVPVESSGCATPSDRSSPPSSGSDRDRGALPTEADGNIAVARARTAGDVTTGSAMEPICADAGGHSTRSRRGRSPGSRRLQPAERICARRSRRRCTRDGPLREKFLAGCEMNGVARTSRVAWEENGAADYSFNQATGCYARSYRRRTESKPSSRTGRAIPRSCRPRTRVPFTQRPRRDGHRGAAARVKSSGQT